MAEELKFIVKLQDLISPSAKAASEGVSKLTSSLRTAKTELASYERQLKLANTLGDIEGHKKYQALVDAGKRKVFGLTQELEGLPKAAEGASGGLAELGGPLGMVVGGAVAAGTAIIALTGELLSYASEATSARLRTIAMFEALGQGEGAGEKTLKMLDDLSDKLPETRAQLTPWAKQLEAIGITDLSQLRGEVVATAAANAMLGEEGAEHYLTLKRRIQEAVDTHTGLKLADKQLAQLGLTGANVNDVAARLGITAKQLRDRLHAGTLDATKFGNALQQAVIAKGKPALAALGADLPTTLAKGRESFEKLFDSIDFKPLTDGLKQFFDIFSEAEPSGQVLKKGITGALNDVVKWLGKAATEVTIFFLEGELLFLKAKLFMQPYVKLWGQIHDAIATALEPLTKLVEFQEKAIGYLPKLLGGKLGLTGGTEPIASPLSPQAWQMAHGAAGPPSMEGPVTPGGLLQAPAHQSGGLVRRPAAGEFFASVQPGEYIMPRSGGGGGSHGGVHIDHVEIHVMAPQGVTDATDISASALARAIERYQLALGR